MSVGGTTFQGRFRSLEDMRDVHHDLLKQSRVAEAQDVLNKRIAQFIEHGRATGVLLDADEDRTTAQSMLDYWSTIAIRNGFEAGDTNLDGFAPGSADELADSDYPYQAVGEYDSRQNSLIFGLDRLTRECLQKLARNNFVIITGGAGSGRSTLVRDGLLPAIQTGRLRDGNWTTYRVPSPGSQPVRALLEAIRPSTAGPAWVEEQAGKMRSDPLHLARLLDAQVDGAAAIVIDSFEQVFTECEDAATRDTLAANLFGVLKEATGAHVVILLLRNDFVSYMSRLAVLELLFDQCQVVVAFTTSELRQAIEEPAKRVGLRFEEGLIDRLLLDIQGDPAAIGLLSFTMFQLWERRTGCWITWEAYRKVGGGGVALERCADDLGEFAK